MKSKAANNRRFPKRKRTWEHGPPAIRPLPESAAVLAVIPNPGPELEYYQVRQSDWAEEIRKMPAPRSLPHLDAS